LAHHLIVDSEERVACGPAALLQMNGLFLERWEDDPRTLDEVALPSPQLEPAPCRAWAAITGDAGHAGVLLRSFFEERDRPCYLVYEQGVDVLSLLVEASALLPVDHRWRATFSTYFSGEFAGAECCWRCVLAGSSAHRGIPRQFGRQVIDLTDPRSIADDRFVESARTGNTVRPPADQSEGNTTHHPEQRRLVESRPGKSKRKDVAGSSHSYEVDTVAIGMHSEGVAPVDAPPPIPAMILESAPKPQSRVLLLMPIAVLTILGGAIAVAYYFPSTDVDNGTDLNIAANEPGRWETDDDGLADRGTDGKDVTQSTNEDSEARQKQPDYDADPNAHGREVQEAPPVVPAEERAKSEKSAGSQDSDEAQENGPRLLKLTIDTPEQYTGSEHHMSILEKEQELTLRASDFPPKVSVWTARENQRLDTISPEDGKFPRYSLGANLSPDTSFALGYRFIKDSEPTVYFKQVRNPSDSNFAKHLRILISLSDGPAAVLHFPQASQTESLKGHGVDGTIHVSCDTTFGAPTIRRLVITTTTDEYEADWIDDGEVEVVLVSPKHIEGTPRTERVSLRVQHTEEGRLAVSVVSLKYQTEHSNVLELYSKCEHRIAFLRDLNPTDVEKKLRRGLEALELPSGSEEEKKRRSKQVKQSLKGFKAIDLDAFESPELKEFAEELERAIEALKKKDRASLERAMDALFGREKLNNTTLKHSLLSKYEEPIEECRQRLGALQARAVDVERILGSVKTLRLYDSFGTAVFQAGVELTLRPLEIALPESYTERVQWIIKSD